MKQILRNALAVECGCRLQDTGVVKGRMRERLRTIAQAVEQRWTDEEWTVKKMIDIHQAIKAGAQSICPTCNHYLVCRVVDNQPCVECNQYSPAVHSRWAHIGGDEWCCPVCGFFITTEGSWDKPTRKYCEDCGTKMDGAE